VAVAGPSGPEPSCDKSPFDRLAARACPAIAGFVHAFTSAVKTNVPSAATNTTPVFDRARRHQPRRKTVTPAESLCCRPPPAKRRTPRVFNRWSANRFNDPQIRPANHLVFARQSYTPRPQIRAVEGFCREILQKYRLQPAIGAASDHSPRPSHNGGQLAPSPNPLPSAAVRSRFQRRRPSSRPNPLAIRWSGRRSSNLR